MSPDCLIAAIAAEQFGMFSREQAIGCGFTPDQIAYRLATGRWVALEPGVYMIAGAPLTWDAQVMGSLLAGGEGARRRLGERLRRSWV